MQKKLKEIIELYDIAHVIPSDNNQQSYLVDWKQVSMGNARVVLCPKATEELTSIVSYCDENALSMQIQGGNTGLVGGSIPNESPGNILISLTKMNKVRSINPHDFTVTVEAGMTLFEVQMLAEKYGLYFPLSLAAEGSCQIGGCVSTNAGGIHVLRYGMMRDLVLGLEVVLPDGRIWNGLSSLIKDNTGYDLKQLFIGAEGTLGIVSAVTLKLFPKPTHKEVFLLGLENIESSPALLSHLKISFDSALHAAEIFSGEGLRRVVNHIPDCHQPMEQEYPWYLLVELGAPHADLLREDYVQKTLCECLEKKLCVDAIFASSFAQQKLLWKLRENLTEAEKATGPSVKHDISVAIHDIPVTVIDLCQQAEDLIPGIRPNIFGHIGDGNLHLNFIAPEGMQKAAFIGQEKTLNSLVYDYVCNIGGSISAEHGIGRSKKEAFLKMKSSVEVELQKRLKKSFDPKGLIGRGVLF